MKIQTTKHHIPSSGYWAIVRGDMRAVPVPITKAPNPKVGDYLEIYEQTTSPLSPSSERRQTFLITHIATTLDSPAIAEGYLLASINRVEVHPKVERVSPPDMMAQFMMYDSDLQGGWE